MAQQKAADPSDDEVDDLIDELQPGAKLLKGQYTITRYINSGGFGITYLAKDSLDRDVVIKECFPSSVCRRSKVMVAARSRAHTAELRSIVQLFVREARSLAKIVHPNIVAVHQVFEDNGTAYMAIDYIDGLDLQQIIDGEGQPLSKAHIVEITTKLLKAVGFIHENDMLHRDISPDNVLIDKTGEPILIDFGAAREKASQTNRAMSALRVVKDGYSPQEFYIAGSEQGPWSDLYALAATLYHVISGEAPVNGQARLAALAEDRPDPFDPLTGRVDGFPRGFLEAIDRALNTLPKQRIQSAADWLAMYASEEVPVVALAEPAPGTDDAVHRLVSNFRRESGLNDAGAVGSNTAGGSAGQTVVPARVPSAGVSSGAAPAPQQRGKSSLPLFAGIAVVVAAAAGGFVLMSNDPAPTDARPAATMATEASAPSPTAAAATEPQNAADTLTATVEPEAKPNLVAEPVVEPASEPAATETAVALPAAATPEPAPAQEEPAPAEPTEVAAATEPASPPVTEAEAEAPAKSAEDPAPDVETATAGAEPAPEAAATPSAAVPASAQIGFAVWDSQLPFTADDRIVGGRPVAQILRVSPGTDLASAGPWLQQGVVIHSINGSPTPTAKALTVAVLNAMQVDLDGKARMVADYTRPNGERNSGLLTVDAVRLLTLANGISLRTATVDGVWKTEVTGISGAGMTTLRKGDVLFRDKSTGIALDGPTSIETILAKLVDGKAMRTEFSIVRDNKVETADMQLVPARAP